jgi:midasin
MDVDDGLSITESDEVEDVDEKLTNTHISYEEVDEQMSQDSARELWRKHEDSTRNLALVLTEQLRLILQPTQATKMRGDFRTGKRLNIKRIIPYIASSYKRDKIWMRRSVPSKRTYQVMLAIDDSKSMTESQSRDLAFETLALVAKSMSMLDVGELSVVSFGEDVKIAHDFKTPFTSDAGVNIFRHFTFSNNKTDVRKLLVESIELFRMARLKAGGSASDLWQLQLIISDGICEDHPSIRRLVRQAHEERIMIVFIIVDSIANQANPVDKSKQSILDLQTAEFVKNGNAEPQLKMVKYLDTFPFRYYLIVRDVQELPLVLSGALRQWFAEVMDTGN